MKRLNVAISILIHSLENFDPVKVNKVYSFFFFMCMCEVICLSACLWEYMYVCTSAHVWSSDININTFSII